MVESEQEGLKWQVGVWDRISSIYLRAIDNRFTGVVDALIRRAALQSVQEVLDLGTGTGSVAIKAASLVMPGGNVTAVDISPEMLELARQRSASLGLSNIEFLEGRAEELPLLTGRFDVVLASLSLMYVIDRAAAAREIARVLRPGGRFVAAVWGGPEEADIVLFQQTAGSFAPARPCRAWVPGRLPIHRAFWLSWRSSGLVPRSNRRRQGWPLKTSSRRGMCLPVLPPLSYRPNGRTRPKLLSAPNYGPKVTALAISAI
jgi:SAM-dependent methyltransferase